MKFIAWFSLLPGDSQNRESLNSEEGVCGFVLGKFQQARTARVCTLALLEIDYFLHLFQVSSDFTLSGT